MRAQTGGACARTHALNGKREIAGVHEPLTACVTIPAGKYMSSGGQKRLSEFGRDSRSKLRRQYVEIVLPKLKNVQ